MRSAALPLLALCATLIAPPSNAAVPGELAGTWTAELKPEQRKVQLNLRTGGDSQWGESLAMNELSGFNAQDGEARFTLTRDAGTLRFEGTFRGGQGAGHYRFEPAAGFAEEMARLGYPEVRGEKALHLALADVGPRRVREYQALGFKALPWDDLFAFCLHDVTPDFVKELRSLGLKMNDPEDVVAMRIHDVTPEFVREMRAAGYTKASADDLLKLRIHGVDKMLLRRKDGR